MGSLLVVGGVSIAASALGAPLAATPRGLAIEYPIGQTGVEVGPLQLATSADGAVWFTSYLQGTIGRFALPNTLNQFAIPSSTARPGAITLGPDGNIWFAETAYDQVGRIATSGDCLGTVTEFAVPSALGGGISGITSDGSHHVWFTSAGGDIVGSLDITANTVPAACANKGVSQPAVVDAGAAMTLYHLRKGSGANGIAVDSHGKVWVAESVRDSIARLDPTVSSASPNFEYLTEWSVPTPQSNPLDIAVGAGDRVWFSENNTNMIATLPATATANTAIVEHSLGGTNLGPTGLTAGPDGAMWFAESTYVSGSVGRITPSGVITQYATPPLGGAVIADVTINTDGTLWYTNFLTDAIGAMSTGAHPAVTTAAAGSAHVGAWICAPAKWGTTPISSSTTWLRNGVDLKSTRTTLSSASVGKRFVCRSAARLPGIPHVFTSSTSYYVTTLLQAATYASKSGATMPVAVVTNATRLVDVRVVRSNGSTVTKTSVRLHAGTNRVALPLRAGSKPLPKGRYVLDVTGAGIGVVSRATLTVR